MLISTDAQAESTVSPWGGGKVTQRWLCVPWTLPWGDVGLLTCQASSCCERFTFCWMASSSWLLRDIMSILHLASSTSTAFFLGGEQEMGHLTYFLHYFKEMLNISLRRSQQFSYLASLQILNSSSPLEDWTVYLSEEWARTADVLTIKTADFR